MFGTEFASVWRSHLTAERDRDGAAPTDRTPKQDTNLMSKFPTTAAALFAATIGVAAYGQSAEPTQNPQQALEQTMKSRGAEAAKAGDKKIEVAERAVWGLGELPPDLMTKAFDGLATNVRQSELNVMQAANILQLQAASNPDLDESDALGKQADALREVARKIEFREVITKEQLREPFAKAAIAAADYYRAEAGKGVSENDEEKTGYSLKGASAYLVAAHFFADKQPSPEVSLAAYNGDTLAEQIINGSKPTTYEVAKNSDGQGGEAQTASSKQDADAVRSGDKANLPDGTKQAVADLEKAIKSAQQAIGQG